MDQLGGIDDSFEDEYLEQESSSKRGKLNFGIFILVIGILGSTVAANVSLSGGRAEFGQGIYQIRACDQWVGVGLTAGGGDQNPYVKNMKLYGFDPRLCLNRIFQIRLFPTGSTVELPLYMDAGVSAGTIDTATSLTLLDTSTAYSSSYTGRAGTGYNAWAADAVTLINKNGVRIGYSSPYLFIAYTAATGVYTIIFAQPRALVADVSRVTIESALYS